MLGGVIADTYFGVGDWHLQLGSIGEWVQGVGAVAVIFVTLRLWRREHKQRLADEERRYSRALSTWLDFTHERPQAVVLNSGPEVISDWHMQVCVEPGCSSHPAHVHRWLPLISNLEEGALVPGEERVRGLGQDEPESNVKRGAVVEVGFIDPAGRRWKRASGSEPERY